MSTTFLCSQLQMSHNNTCFSVCLTLVFVHVMIYIHIHSYIFMGNIFKALFGRSDTICPQEKATFPLSVLSTDHSVTTV